MSNEESDIDDSKIRKELSDFLRTMADSIEHNTLDLSTQQKASDTFLQYKFISKLYNDLTCEHSEEEKDESDLLKFLSLGWYMYTQIQQTH